MHLPLIAACLASYDDKNTDHRKHTFDTITKFVVERLPPILSAATQMAAHAKAFSVTATTTAMAPIMTLQEVSTAYAAVLTELEKLKKSGGKRNAKGGAKGKNKRQKPAKGGAKGKNKRQKPEGGKAINADNTGKCDFYCFVHGSQNSHTSRQCKVMANQPKNFSPEQRNASGPNAPLGGSVAVRGRDPLPLNPQ